MSRSRAKRALIAVLTACSLAAVTVLAAAPPAAAEYFPISGTVSTAAGAAAPSQTGYVSFRAPGGLSGFSSLDSAGHYSVQLEPGTYVADVVFSTGGTGYQRTNLDTTVGPFEVTETSPATLDITLPAHPLRVTVENSQGSPAFTRVRLRCTETVEREYENEEGPYTEVSERDTSVSTSYYDPSEGPALVYGAVVPDDEDGLSRCWLGTAHFNGAYTAWAYQRVDIAAGDNEADVTHPDPVTLRGQLTLPDAVSDAINVDGEGHVQVYTQAGDEVIDPPLRPGNWYEVQVPPGGPYDIQLTGRGQTGGEVVLTETASITGNTTVDFTMRAVPVTVHLAWGDVEPTDRHVAVFCQTPGKYTHWDNENYDDLMVGVQGPDTTQITVPVGLSEDGWTCRLRLSLDEEPYEIYAPLPAGIGPGHQDVTWLLDSLRLVAGVPGESVDEDGVEDNVESQGPNGGDGNNDGVADYQQNHVTSVPAFGTTETEDVPFVTVAGPAGSSLVDVSTMNPEEAESPPPGGATLPAGLTSFTLRGVASGSTQTVELWTNTELWGVNAYAKYDPDAGTWSMLPEDRVEVFGDHIAIELTDGGIGDADGLENGIIVDPGGPAAVPSGDTTPPEVTGEPTTQPNRTGWYRTNVRIDWTATDADSGVESQPADTVVTTQGADVTATSPEVCDTAPTPNCATGQVTGLKIDKTAPSLSVTGVSDGATYTLGSVPTPGCSASDALSGLAAPCRGVRLGGNSAGVGAFSYAASASDEAGNARLAAAGYRVVYRFDGFLQPVNDPGPPVSVFKAGSTVLLAFNLKRANGQAATPSSKPVWVSPVRGARTTLRVNEPVSNAKGATGSAFAWKNNRWEFNWSTKGLTAGYLYRIGVRLDDGTTHAVTVGLR